MGARPIAKDVALAFSLAVFGGALLLGALRAGWVIEQMNPSIEGAITVGVVGFVLALLHPVGYRRAVIVSAPVLAVQAAACFATGGPAAGVVGVELLFFGVVGIVKGIVADRRVPEGARSKAKAAPIEARVAVPEGHAVVR